MISKSFEFAVWLWWRAACLPECDEVIIKCGDEIMQTDKQKYSDADN